MIGEYFILSVLGFVVGTLGTLIGAGGGFILVPFLLYLYPKNNPETITAISLAVVFLNAFSGSIAYARKKRIDFRSAVIFSIATTPGALLGAYVVSFIKRSHFEIGFGIVLIMISSYILLKKSMGVHRKPNSHSKRILVDSHGESHEIGYSMTVGILVSVGVGFVSTLLGIGGGIIHVPAMVDLLHFPVHIATATSHCVLAFSALMGTLVHMWQGHLNGSYGKIIALGLTVIIGAQVGAYLSHKIHGRRIVKALALALFLVGLRLLIRYDVISIWR